MSIYIVTINKSKYYYSVLISLWN